MNETTAISGRLPDSEASRHQAARRSTLVSVWVNIALSIAQITIGLVARSQALLSDGVHSLSDLVADFVVLFASQHSKKGPDDDHQYGHHRFENAASLVLGVLLLAVGVGMLWSAALKFKDPASIPVVHVVALWVALGALVSKEVLFRYMLRVAKRIRSSMLIANAWHARSDAASSLVVAVGIVGNLMGYPLLDPIAALIVGFMVGKMGWAFAWQALNDLMDCAADEEHVAAITLTLKETEGVMGLHDLRTRKVGDMILVDVHLEVADELSVIEGHTIATAARANVIDRHPVLDVMTHIDPISLCVLKPRSGAR
jgi:cation diffusion facilitator family transporter